MAWFKKHAQWFIVVGIVGLCAAVLLLAIGSLEQAVTTNDSPTAFRPCVLVDAGHGAFDGGAVAADGTQEKEINLAISKPLASMLTVCGFRVTQTRTQDTALHDDDSAPIRQKKVSDMKNRLLLYEEADLNISIHQNMFGAAAYHGAQVFYSANHPFSKVLAASVKEEIVRLVQPDNSRELKEGNRDIYLLYKTTKPTVLVECGFLSNAEELKNLKSEEYQRQTAFAVVCGVMNVAFDAPT